MASLSGNKLFILLSLVIASAVMMRCSGENEKDKAETGDTGETCRVQVNPNGDSELALLMRQMLHSSESMKELVKQGRVPDRFPSEFLKIHTAKPTADDTKKPSFDSFADNYIINLKALYSSPKEELTEKYNAVVNSCVSCHQEHCPGPLKAIHKLAL